MIRTIWTIFKYSLIIIGGIFFIDYLFAFMSGLDYTLIAYAMNIISKLRIPITLLFDYPNVLLLFGYLFFLDLITIFLELLKARFSQ
jgi:hypothetical protein